jgi:hypothetical protein
VAAGGGGGKRDGVRCGWCRQEGGSDAMVGSGGGVVEGKERWRCSGREGAVSLQWEKGRKEHDEGRSV